MMTRKELMRKIQEDENSKPTEIKKIHNPYKKRLRVIQKNFPQ